MNKEAFLIIDIQEDSTGTTAKAPFPYPNSEEMVSNINSFINYAQEKEMLIAYIQQTLPNNFFSKLLTGGRFLAGTEGIKLDSKLKVVNQNIFSKILPSALSNNLFKSFLKDNGIKTLYIAGIDLNGCVNRTILNAIKEGYEIKLLKDCTATLWPQKTEKNIRILKEKGVSQMSLNDFNLLSK